MKILHLRFTVRSQCCTAPCAVFACQNANASCFASVAGTTCPVQITTKIAMHSLILFLLLGVSLNAADDGSRWWSHVAVLADDNMEGRNTGSPGHHRAAAYIAGKFKEAGLKPGGKHGYLQPVLLESRRIVEQSSSLELVRDGKTTKLTLGKEAFLSSRVNQAPKVEAELVFVGYGIQLPEANCDDFAGLDLKGKIAVYLSATPPGISGAVAAHAQSAAERWKAMLKAGAVGSASISAPGAVAVPWVRASAARLQASMSLLDKSLTDEAGHNISAVINPAHAALFFEGTGHSWEEILAAHKDSKQLPHFAMNRSLRATARIERGQVKSENVVGVIAGTDPSLKSELLVLSAHMDHLGVNKSLKGDQIFNGAMDNASGVAALLEIAAKLSKSKPKRSIVLVAVTGEEKGLLGSRYFANRPSVKGTIVADLNMDMFMPIHKLESVIVLGIEESTLNTAIEQSAAESGLKLQPDPVPQQRRFIRSDQYSFILRGFPSAAFKFGYEKGSPEEAMQTEWLAKRYHAVSDDLSQPVDKAGAARFIEFLGRAAELVANQPERPKWRDDSFFKRFAN